MSNDNYPTPEYIQKIFRNYYDPCPLNPIPQKDGLKEEWGGRTFVNPPYSDPLPWVEKAIKESREKGKFVVLLLRADTSTKWFARLLDAQAEICWFYGRLAFGTFSRANFPSMLAILDGKLESD